MALIRKKDSVTNSNNTNISIDSSTIKPNNSNNINNLNKKVEINFKAQEPKYSFKDIILPDHVREQLKDVISSRKYSKTVFEDWGLLDVMPEGANKLAVNLYGPPGTGKTMGAHVIAKELGRKLLCVNYSEIESKYVGETSKNLEKVFAVAKEQNLILFFDEADALLSKRVTNMNNSTDVSVNQTRSVLLMLMNDYKDVILFATNFINNFDEAFMRRIQFHIKFELPCIETRKVLWEKYIPEKMPNNADIEELSRKYEGVTGSDISNAVKMAAFKAARLEQDCVDNKYFEESISSIVKSKLENKSSSDCNVSKRYVSEDYAKSQLSTNI